MEPKPAPEKTPEQKTLSTSATTEPKWKGRVAVLGAVAAVLSALAAWIVPLIINHKPPSPPVSAGSSSGGSGTSNSGSAGSSSSGASGASSATGSAPSNDHGAIPHADGKKSRPVQPDKAQQKEPAPKVTTPKTRLSASEMAQLAGIPLHKGPLTQNALAGWVGTISVRYSNANFKIKAEAASDSGYFGGVSAIEPNIRSAAQHAVDMCKYYVQKYGANDPETCSIIMVNEVKIGDW